MTLIRSVLLSAAMMLPAIASAQQPVPAGAAVFQIVPHTPVTGGTAPHELYLLVLAADGTPLTQLKLKSPKIAGIEKRWIEVGEGIYRMPFNPPEVLSPSMLTISAKGKTPEGIPLATSADVLLQPAAPSFSLDAAPSQLILGQDPGATLTITGIDATAMRSIASVGTLSVSGGNTTGVTLGYEPPKLNYPHVAIAAVTDTSDLSRYGYDVVRLDGAVNFPVKSDPQSSIVLDVGGRTFGPVIAGADGKAKVAIIVPPGINEATQVATSNGTEKREQLELHIPETRRLQMIPLPQQIPANGSQVPLRVIVMEPTGEPDVSAVVEFVVTTGEVAAATHLGQGVYEALWTPNAPPGMAGATVTVGLGTAGSSDGQATAVVQRETLEVSFVHEPPATVSLVAGVPSIDATSSPFDVTALVKRADGASYPGAQLTIVPLGASIAGEVVDLGDGSYRFTVVPDVIPTGSGEASLRVTAKSSAASHNPVASVRLHPSNTRVVNDGKDQLSMQMAAMDAFGMPVASLPLVLEVTGDGTLATSQLVTNEQGIATTTYTSGATPSVIAFQVTAGNKTSHSTVLQLPATAPALALRWETATSAASVSTFAEGTLVIPRAGAVGGEILPVASIRLGSDLPTAVPGATITITATPLDAQGTLTRSLVPELVVTGAIASPPAVGSDGAVTVVVAIPEDASGPIEIKATAGEVIQTLSVPVERDDPWASGATAAIVPVPVEVTPPNPSPPESASYTWLRLRASGIGSQYRYEQLPSSAPGPLLPTTLAVGSGNGGGPASPIGAEFDLRAWGDVAGVPYVGVHAQTRFSRYGVQAAAFNGVARDVLPSVILDVAGRYPFDLQGNRYWVGATAGFHYTDFLSYRGCLDPGCQVRTEPINVAGLGLGAELGAEIGDLFAVGGYKLGLARASQPYANAIDLNVGYSFIDHAFADLGLGLLTRRILLEGTESGLERGELRDSQLMVELGVGFSL